MKEEIIQKEYINKLKDYVLEKEKSLCRKLTCHITTFGCQMNAKDSEKLLGILIAAGFVEVDNEEADFVLFNTCTVRENANEKVYGRLGRLSHYKKSHPDTIIAICGCMMQEADEVETIKNKYKFVDIVFGTHNIFKLAEILYKHLETNNRIFDVWEGTNEIVEMLPSVRKYNFKCGVNIMFGCDNFCSYCIVPYVRGRERSRNSKDIIEEIKGLVKDGVVEVMLLGQNVNSYGKNTDDISFPQLLEQIQKIDGLKRLRFMTSHPKDLSPQLIDVMANSNVICKHLHLPLQSGSTKILKDMNRHYTKEDYLTLVKNIKEKIPDISLTTDIIVGFPGETDEDFEETLDVVRKVKFDSAFTFIYSKREGTPAAKLEMVPDYVIKNRFNRLLDVVNESANDSCKKDINKVLDVLVEEVNEQNNEYVTGKLSNNITVHFKGDKSLIGQIVPVKLIESKGFYYIGEAVCYHQ